MEYNFRAIEDKWQQYWRQHKTYRVETDKSKPKYYVLDMFPYPSGAGLHVGHPLGYIASDIYSRYKRLRGFNVLHPMGYDSFGLPAEQYAIQTGQHPAITTEQNIARYREQLDRMGFSFDWDREVRTSDPKFYKWTQWIFIQLFHSWYNNKSDKAEKIETLIAEFEKSGNANVDACCSPLSFGEGRGEVFTSAEWKKFSEKEQQELLMNYRFAFLSETMVNWCPQLGSVLANDEVKDGVSERGGYPVERKLMQQWSLRITAYSQRLLDDLDTIDWSESLKESQRNWIGRSEGTSISFRLTPSPSPVERGAQPHMPSEDAASSIPSNDSGISVVQHYKTANTDHWEKKKEMIRENRKNPTPAEEFLWQRLRNSKLGFKIRRQHPIENFVVDFVCIDRMLVIEADGEIHNQQLEYDAIRTEILESYGFKVIRFKNEIVEKETDKVISEIKAALESRPPKSAHYWRGDAPDDLSSKESVEKATNDLSFNRPEPTTDNSSSELSTDDLSSELSTDDLSSERPPLHGRGAGGEANRNSIEVFTTRPDTIFGATYLTLAPEHELVSQITTPENKKAVDEYVTWASNRSERDRQSDVKKITGVFTGAYAEHPFSKKPMPIWVGDYVLAGYGTGAVMAVPAHDTRDYSFAKHFSLPIVKVIEPPVDWDFEKESYDEKSGKCINSDFLNNLEVKDAIKRAIEEIEKQNIGKGKINFRQRDAIFGRQRYWGEPIPIYYKDNIPYTLPESELPLILPEVDKYLPTETGEPPLARAKDFNYEGYPLETTTMPGWAGSSWYFLRYMDAQNENEFASKEATDYWENVDLYLGGTEHATGHLLYVRFWTKFLKDLGYINVDEPAKKLINQGMIQGTSSKVIRLVTSTSGVPNTNIPLLPANEIPPIFISKNIFLFLNDINRNTAEELDYKGEVRSEIKALANKYTEIIKSRNPKCDGMVDISYEVHYLFNVDINLVERNILDIDKFKEWRNDFKKAEFIKEKDGQFICAEEVEKMSKSKYNVVNPDDMCDTYGTDCFRMYEMFLGPLEQSKPWNTNGITGVSGFLKKLWRLYEGAKTKDFSGGASKEELKVIHKTIKKITEDIERFSFNTSVSSFMICVNELTDLKCSSREVLQPLSILLSPYAPHIAEELWAMLGNAPSVTKTEWPIYDEQYLIEDAYEYPVSINGKKRFTMSLSLNLKNNEIENEVLAADKMKELLNGVAPKKVIVIPGKIVNVVT